MIRVKYNIIKIISTPISLLRCFNFHHWYIVLTDNDPNAILSWLGSVPQVTSWRNLSRMPPLTRRELNFNGVYLILAVIIYLYSFQLAGWIFGGRSVQSLFYYCIMAVEFGVASPTDIRPITHPLLNNLWWIMDLSANAWEFIDRMYVLWRFSSLYASHRKPLLSIGPH